MQRLKSTRAIRPRSDGIHTPRVAVCCNVLQCIAVWCSVLQHAVECCSVL